MSYNSDLERVRKRAEAQGFRYRLTERNHHQFYSPDKESIVVTAGTPGDVRGWTNFMADMKRAGYKDSDLTLSLGEALSMAKANGNGADHHAPSTMRATGVTDAIVEYLHGEMMPRKTNAIVEAVQAKHPTFTRESIVQACANAAAYDRLVKTAHATYTVPGRVARAVIPPLTQSDPPPDAMVVRGVAPAKAEVDPDEVELDEALAALGRIETMVRKYKGIVRQMADLRRIMNTMKLPGEES